MEKKILLLLLLLIITPSSIFARDPHPTKQRTKYMVTPERIDTDSPTDPETMIGQNGKKADIISWSCYDGVTRVLPQGQSRYYFFKDIGTNEVYNETQAEAKRQSVCLPLRANFTETRPPYLKNNVTTSACINSSKYPYDPDCYFWPIGQFLGTHPKAAKGGGIWATPLVYIQTGEIPNLCGPTRDQPCNWPCIYLPLPENPSSAIKNEFVTLKDGTKECVAPPYTTSGAWWNWLKGQINSMQPGILAKNPDAIGVTLGIDGEGRPIKSQTPWVPQGVNLDARFNGEYVPAVIAEIKRLYPRKTIRSMADGDLKNLYLNNDIDFHRESLASDEVAAYLYKGLPVWGWWQGYTNYFWITNSLGLGQGWPPYYISALSALSKHTDAITGIYVYDGTYMNGEGTFLKFIGDYMGKDINDTPGVWINLRDTMVRRMECFVDYNRTEENKQDPNCPLPYYTKALNFSGKYGDYDYYLYRPEDLNDNHTQKVSSEYTYSKNPAVKNQIYQFGLPGGYWPRPPGQQYIGRKVADGSHYMSFDVDDGYRYIGRNDVTFSVRIVFFDEGSGTFSFQYKDRSDTWKEKIINKGNTLLWKEERFILTDALFNNKASIEFTNGNIYPTDFRLFFGSPNENTIINLIEVKGQEDITPNEKPKAQISCDLLRNESDDPEFGIYSVKVGDNIKVKATLADNNGRPLNNERVMMTYNTEWNLAKSGYTRSNGTVYFDLSTANNTESSGFMGIDSGSRPDKPSQYTVQVYFPGNANFQPSRNDCLLMLTGSSGPSDPDNTRLEITDLNENTNPPQLTYKVWWGANMSPGNPGTLLLTKTIALEKMYGFYPDDLNSQTVNIYWSGEGDVPTRTHQASSNNLTLHMPPSIPPFTPSISLKTGWNRITLPHPAYSLTSVNLPSFCKRLTQKPGGIRFSSVLYFRSGFPLEEGSKYNIFCSQNTTW